MLAALNLDAQQLTRQQTQFGGPARDLAIGPQAARVAHVPDGVIQQEGGEIMAQRVTDDDAVLDDARDVGLDVLEAARGGHVRGPDAADGRAPVGHGLLGPHVRVVDLLRVVVDDADAGQRRLVAVRAHADHFAVERDVFPDLDCGGEPGVDGGGCGVGR